MQTLIIGLEDFKLKLFDNIYYLIRLIFTGLL